MLVNFVFRGLGQQGISRESPRGEGTALKGGGNASEVLCPFWG